MNSFAILFFLVNAVALLWLPRRLAPLPLVVGASYMTMAQGFDLGPFSFTVIRMLVVVGFLRIISRGESLDGGLNRLDWIMVLWAAWVIITSAFRPDIMSALVFRLGLIFNTCGTYFLFRVFCRTVDDLWELLRITAILLLPIAIAMVYEQVRFFNLFSHLGGVPSIPIVRDGNIRAQGPFRHPILAGTVGAVCLPMMVALWGRYRLAAIFGIVSCVAIVLCSRSSGPLASLIVGVGGLLMWHYRGKMRLVRWLAIMLYIALDIVMKAPAYYLMGRIPLVAGSTGWHRAELINSALRHLNEWWLWGTDYTRHWMPTGVSWSPNHSDITNHYLQMGVVSGLPSTFLFIATLAIGFGFVGKFFKQNVRHPIATKFLVWSLGASLFANAATMISVSYFDQSFLFLYLTLAAISSVWTWTVSHKIAHEHVRDTCRPRPRLQYGVYILPGEAKK